MRKLLLWKKYSSWNVMILSSVSTSKLMFLMIAKIENWISDIACIDFFLIVFRILFQLLAHTISNKYSTSTLPIAILYTQESFL